MVAKVAGGAARRQTSARRSRSLWPDAIVALAWTTVRPGATATATSAVQVSGVSTGMASACSAASTGGRSATALVTTSAAQRGRLRAVASRQTRGRERQGPFTPPAPPPSGGPAGHPGLVAAGRPRDVRHQHAVGTRVAAAEVARERRRASPGDTERCRDGGEAEDEQAHRATVRARARRINPERSVPGLERRLERGEVLQLVVQPAQALEHAVHLALRPLELLRAHLRAGVAQLIVERDEPVDAGDTRLGDATVDLAREVDEVIGLADHLFHRVGPIALRRKGDNTARMRIGNFLAALETIQVGDEGIELWRVADLEDHVDRTALLAADDPPEPPYWAHLWSGALVLAEAVPRGRRTVLEIGCGLGLPGLVAARRGARVTFVDPAPAALAFLRARAAAHRLAD